jgi:hypothetical protein
MGRGTILLTTVSFDVEASDFPLRPAFLVLLDRFVEMARSRGGARVIEAGGTFVLHGSSKVDATLEAIAEGGTKRLETTTTDGVLRLAAPRIGRYALVVDGASEIRWATAPEREIDLRPRPIAPRAHDPSLGGQTRKLDVSPFIALGLLGLLVVELALRLFMQRGAKPMPAPAIASAAEPPRAS